MTIETSEPRKEDLDKLLPHQEEELAAPLAEIRPNVERIVSLLGPQLKTGAYDHFIGIDSSGRLLALILYRVAKQVAEANGEEGPKLSFISPRRKTAENEMTKTEKEDFKKQYAERIRQIKGEGDENILLIDDFTKTGGSIRPIVDAIDDYNKSVDEGKIRYNLATLEIRGDKYAIDEIVGSRVVTGFLGAAPSTYDKPELAGVQKKEGSVVSKPTEVGRKSKSGEMRENISVFADQVTKTYLSKEKNSLRI